MKKEEKLSVLHKLFNMSSSLHHLKQADMLESLCISEISVDLYTLDCTTSQLYFKCFFGNIFSVFYCAVPDSGTMNCLTKWFTHYHHATLYMSIIKLFTCSNHMEQLEVMTDPERKMFREFISHNSCRNNFVSYVK